MEKMKKTLVLVLFLLIASPMVFAQANQDCSIKYNLFKGDYKAKKYDAAFDNWMWCMDNCPSLSINIYKYGIKIAEYKLKNANEADKKTAADLVMRVFNQRLKYYPTKNKARVYNDIATFKASQGNSDTEVYSWLEKAFKEDPTALSGKNMYRYFDIVLSKNKDTNPQLVFDTYDQVAEGVDKKFSEYSKKINAINAKDSTQLNSKDIRHKKIYQQILTVLAQVEGGLDAKLASISTCENLIPLNKKYFEEKKNDKVWLKRAVSRMYSKECTDDPFYDTLVEQFVAADPSPQASVFYAGILMKKGQSTKAMDYFKQAIDQETDPYKKAQDLLRVAQILSKKGRKGEARSNCYKALKYAPTMGNAYLLISGLYASSANACGTDVVSKRMVYVAALNMARKAKSVDPSIGSKANKYIRAYSKNLPTKKDLFVAGVKPGSTHRIGCWIQETVRVPNK